MIAAAPPAPKRRLARPPAGQKHASGFFWAKRQKRVRKTRAKSLRTRQVARPATTKTASGVRYYGYRYYSPSLGRFINRDPIEEQGGINLYSFVGNNSINAWDYLGMYEISAELQARYDAIYAATWWLDDGMDGQDYLEASTWASNYAVTGTGNYNAENSGAGAPSTHQVNANLRKFNALPPAVQDQVLRDLGVQMGTSGSAPNSGSGPNPSSRGDSTLGNALRNIPLVGGLLGGVGDVIAGVGNTALGIVSGGQSGTLSRGVGQIGGGLVGVTEIVLTDVVATTVGLGGTAFTTVRDVANVATFGQIAALGNVDKKSGARVKTGIGGALSGLVAHAVIPDYGFYGGAGWGTDQFGRDGKPAPLNRVDQASYTHDKLYEHLRWVKDAWSPKTEGVAPGLGGIVYTLLGTVPFSIGGALQGGSL